jgi:predicted DsbA family dithiol-disulfide isomerase
VSVLPITVFSDFTCPYSFVTEAALWRRAGDGVDLRFRAFELYPEGTQAPSPREEPGWQEQLRPLMVEMGMEIAVPDFRPRTGKAHEAAAFARAAAAAEIPLRRAIFEAYWRRGQDIGRIDVLVGLAAGVGLDGEGLKIALDIDTHGESRQRDAALAARLRVPGAPTIFLGEGATARVLLGAQSASALDEALAVR